MKKAIITVLMVLFVLMCFSKTGVAEVSINIGISLPPAVVFSRPPELVVIPGTYVYVAPDVPEDVFYCQGYWWRQWKGNWYRSSHYDRGWVYYSNPPYELRRIPSTWRDDYKDRHWKRQEWHYSRMPHQVVERNWWTWESRGRWEKPQYRQTRYEDGRNYSHRDDRWDDRRDDGWEDRWDDDRRGDHRDDRRGDQRDDRRDDRRGDQQGERRDGRR